MCGVTARAPRTLRKTAAACIAVVLFVGMLPAPATQAADVSLDVSARDALGRTWKRTDKPVAAGKITRTWMWGPALTGVVSEPAQDAPGGMRDVQYFDKSRMEVSSDPRANPGNIWFITNGLLAREMVTGRIQLGPDTFEARSPAGINIAGDPDDPNGATYASFAGHLADAAASDGATITRRISRDGKLSDDPALAAFGVTAAYRVQAPGLDHQVANVFWRFMTTAGLVYEDGLYRTEPLFENPFYAT
ncbi:MAG: hypothetical protein DCC58_00005, partial [Chloroflexi bacterium]